MTVTHTTRTASVVEITSEMDRRGTVIEELEAKLDAQMAGHRLSAKQSTENLVRAVAAEKRCDALAQAGKHLAVKLADVYRAAGQNPADCQAIREWMTAIQNRPEAP